ncbi:IS4 transposase [Sulfurisphaera ohwakuensis]|uniref:IS4 transposase n=1 Tax=Sulfurisphaera ohwakuensis TaxID=69656 RepID=A0A7J9RYI0_SULOH|nr:IS4 transposase [Sulfurisphaera ohwakuensis]
MVFADREFAVNDVIKFLLDMGLDFVIVAKVQTYMKYEKRLKKVDGDYAGVRYIGFLCVRHDSGVYLVILKREDGKVIGFFG